VSDAAEDVIGVVRGGARGYVTKAISGEELTDAIVRVSAGTTVPVRDLIMGLCRRCPEPCLVVVPAGAGLVFSPPAGPGVAGLAGRTARGRGGQPQQAAGFGDADLDQAGVFGGRLVRAGREDAGVAPVPGLLAGTGDAAGRVRRRGLGAGGGSSIA
jgi:hypothetical protein